MTTGSGSCGSAKFKSRRVLLTGASGFVGANVLRRLLIDTQFDIVAPITYQHSGRRQRLESACSGAPDWDRRVKVLHFDLASEASLQDTLDGLHVDAILSVASSSGVDQSIASPVSLIQNNVDLMLRLLQFAIAIRPAQFIHLSSDEVYGEGIADDLPREWRAIVPSSPYAASKAAQEAIAIAYWRTYGVPLILLNSSNLVGPMLGSDKFLPQVVAALLEGKPVTVHTGMDGREPGRRRYMHVEDIASALIFALEHVSPRDARNALLPHRFHVGGAKAIDNETLVRMVARFLGIHDNNVKIVYDSASRPGYDAAHPAPTKALEVLGWRGPSPVEEAIRRTVGWFAANPRWESC